MKFVFTTVLILSLFSCKVEPEPLIYGEDACHHCKMTLMDRKFGAELVTRKGKVYKFDDINCMVQFFHSGGISQDQFAHKLVVDFSQPEKLISAGEAFYLKSAEIKSPMASQIAAFEKEASLNEVKSKWNGIYLVWGELVTQFK